MSSYALITGASSGIGLSISKELAVRNYNLLLVSNQEEGLEIAKNEIESFHDLNILTLNIDLSSSDAPFKVFEYCENNELEIEVLINNAGVYFFGEIVNVDIQKAMSMIDLHVRTHSILCSLFGEKMKERKRGYILNNSSISAYKDFPGIGYYGGTKAYLKSFTRSLRMELKPYEVHVTCLLPGATATNLYDPNVIDIEKGKKWGIMMDASKVAKIGIDALFANKGQVVPGLMTKVMLFFTRITPYWIIYIIRKYSNILDKSSATQKP